MECDKLLNPVVLKGNVLLTATFEPLLCDFGLSRIRHEVSRTLTTIHTGGRQRFMAPELLAGVDEKFRTSKATDVYSEALILVTAWTGKVPLAEIRNELAVAAHLRDGQRPTRSLRIQQKSPLDLETAGKFWDYMEIMWAQDPAQRPSAQEVESRLETLFEQFVLDWPESESHRASVVAQTRPSTSVGDASDAASQTYPYGMPEYTFHPSASFFNPARFAPLLGHGHNAAYRSRLTLPAPGSLDPLPMHDQRQALPPARHEE